VISNCTLLSFLSTRDYIYILGKLLSFLEFSVLLPVNATFYITTLLSTTTPLSGFSLTNMPELKILYYRKDFFFIINVVRYCAFCNDLDQYNGYPVDRVQSEAAWDNLLEQKSKKYDGGWLSRRWPGKEYLYLDYLLYRAGAQVSSTSPHLHFCNLTSSRNGAK
jgi:hypothetical protein